MRLSDHVRTDTGWEIVDESPSDGRIVMIGSNFLVGNGHLGYRGTRPDQTATDFVGCTVADTYDMADGVWRELCTVPNGLFVSLRLDGEPLRADHTEPAEIELTMATGEVTHRATWRTLSGAAATVSLRRFASLDDLHVVGQELTVVAHTAGVIEVSAGIDSVVWSLNGDHFADATSDVDGDVLTRTSVTVERATKIVVASCTQLATSTDASPAGTGPPPDLPTPAIGGEALEAGGLLGRRWLVRLGDGEALTVTTAMGVASSNDDDADDPRATATESAVRLLAQGYRAALAASARRWAEYWETADVRIDGDPGAQAALRFSLYHHRIATPAHSDRLPIGARGLSCQAYQGAAFWDQEMFNLPAYLFTAPEIARNLLVYRWRTLDGARRKARRLGYAGAYYAWISGDTGDELCPDFFFTDVLTGRPIRNHFNVWQMHVSPDIAHAVWSYWEATADEAFLVDHGAEILFEVARFLHSFVRYDEHHGRYELIRVLGPDEWHENVDNDAYTARITQLALDHAVEAHHLLARRSPSALARLRGRLGIADDDLGAWRRVRDHLHVPAPDPDTHVIEQFDGFFELEDCRPDDVRARLLDPGEYWGWPNGVAVHTQVSKQPAVVQLLAVDSSFPLDVQRANYDHYRPRCAHGSSLSHSVHATVAARLARAGDESSRRYLQQAYDDFMRTATIDLLAAAHSTIGGTFIGGMHTAANAGAYTTAVFGFGGLGVDGDAVVVDPHLPQPWNRLGFEVVFRGRRLTVEASRDRTTVTAAAGNDRPVPVRCPADAAPERLDPGASLTFARRRRALPG